MKPPTNAEQRQADPLRPPLPLELKIINKNNMLRGTALRQQGFAAPAGGWRSTAGNRPDFAAGSR